MVETVQFYLLKVSRSVDDEERRLSCSGSSLPAKEHSYGSQTRGKSDPNQSLMLWNLQLAAEGWG